MKTSIERFDHWVHAHLTVVIVVVVLITSVVLAFHTKATAALSDFFHEGEYLSSILLPAPSSEIQPVLIHGAMDIVPASIAATLGTSGSLVVDTRLARMFFIFLGTLAFFALSQMLVRRLGEARLAWAVFLALLFTAFIAFAPGVHDVFLLGELLFIVLYFQLDKNAFSLWHTVYSAGVGLCAATAVFWSYNRGMIGFGLFFLFLVYQGLRDRKSLSFAALTFAAAVSVYCLVDRSLVSQTLQNILYWSKHEDIWRYPLNLYYLSRIVPAILLFAGVAYMVGRAAWRYYRMSRPGDAAIGTVLLLTLTMSVLQSTNRMDAAHVALSIPYVALCFAYLISSRQCEKDGGKSPPAAITTVLPHRMAFLCLLLVFLDLYYPQISALRTYGSGLTSNVMQLIRRPPSDLDLVEADQAQVAKILAGSGDKCTYVFENSGAFYLLSNKSPCSNFLYPIYAGEDYQQVLIRDLERNKPKIVLKTSTAWNAIIDGKTLHDRTPLIEKWLQVNYPYVKKIGRYVLGASDPHVFARVRP